MASGRVCESGIETVDGFWLVKCCAHTERDRERDIDRMYGEIYLQCMFAYPLRLCGHADELLVGHLGTAASSCLSPFRLKLFDEIALQANGAITIVHLTLERDTISLLLSAHCIQYTAKRYI